MIADFAMDPRLIADWCRLEEFDCALNEFGLDARRLISTFPVDWRDKVWEAYEQLNSPDPLDEARLNELINHLTLRTIERQRGAAGDWLLETESEHQSRSFDQIVARENPREHEDILVGNKITSLHRDLVRTSHGMTINRTPADMSNAISPLLRCCQRIAFVDPHMEIQRPRYQRSLEAFLDLLARERIGPSDPIIEFHSSVAENLDERAAGNRAHFILGHFNERLPRILPRGFTAKAVVWKRKPGGVQLHNRYVITDIGSVSFGHGLDCYDVNDVTTEDEGRPEDDVFCLTEEQHIRKWNHYLGTPAAFVRVDEVDSITGRKNLR